MTKKSSNQHKQHQKQKLETCNITIQETKLTEKSKTPKIPQDTTIRTDREHKQGVGLIKSDITFINIPRTINTHNTELQLVRIHINKTKHITVANTDFPPRDTTSPHYNTVDIAHCIQHATNRPDLMLSCDVNTHSTLWYSHTDDLSCNSSLSATLSKFRPQYTQEPEVKQFSFNHLIKEEKDQKKIMRTPVTATRTGDEFYVGNNGEANQSKYPIELRARLTRQNYIHACIIRYGSIILLVSVQYMYSR